MIQEAITGYTVLIRRIGTDSRMLATHVSLLTALFVLHGQQGYANPFSVSRRKLMAHCRIRSIATYHKCMRELDTFGYVRYQPSYHPTQGSLIWWPSKFGERKEDME
ncbi:MULTISPECIES: hypothetical protein [Sphingobacterium]|uniref:hypothetical protein n=1 Tax=Sphingobacterium TaxID=28453 RepID=UPI002580B791|nr:MULTISPECIES: hypothetical protein [Sphingobacterium]